MRAVGEVHDRAIAVVGAERAVLPGLFDVVERVQLVEADERARRVAILLLHRQQADADRAHEFGIGRARDLVTRVQLHGAQDRVVAERAALHDDLVAERLEVVQADDLREDVLDDAAAQAGEDVVGRLAVLEFGDDAAAHEHGAAAAELGRVRAVEGARRDVLDGDAEALREGLDERAAAARAGFVERDARDDTVVDEDGLHVLAADV